MHLEKIEALVGIMRNSNVGELELTEGMSRIRLTRFAHAAAGHDGPPANVPAGDAAAHPRARFPDGVPSKGDDTGVHPANDASGPTMSAGADEATGAAEHAAPAGDRVDVIAAPLFGVVHLAPSPLDPPFVKVGDRIAEGDTLCTIEAMKTFNVIEAEQAGIVTEILTHSGREVAPGAPLFRVTS
ncbi:hypothetical protein OVY01_01300 [Robbsia sp. Bb-Pol-6]|uniref:Biotin carboxyl carrier protein of acetyl-CoA carboxylase n=1 Tax=Robbsia betulipollinis TaxID=2981849 RepID=A0ABT3ZHK0_9BURK|nr:biotin/lipoyl-containing protein [Robbsia betulipollinis]MCY0385897.1 hypothetical protein [Robbsia betulipollinis]